MSQRKFPIEKKQKYSKQQYSQKKSSSEFHSKIKKDLVEKLSKQLKNIELKKIQAYQRAIQYNSQSLGFEKMGNIKKALEAKQECEFWSQRWSQLNIIIHEKQLLIKKYMSPLKGLKKGKDYLRMMSQKQGPSDDEA